MLGDFIVMTTRERLEMKFEKRQEWAESRQAKAAQEWDKGDMSEEKTGIPFGQPILVGHHSERRHRRVIERADNAMRRAAEHSDMAKHHAEKAAGIQDMLAGSIFSDDPDAVEALEAKISGMEKERERNNQINKIVRQNPKYKPTPEKLAALATIGLPDTVAAGLFSPDWCGRIGIPAYVNQNIGGRIKAARDRLVMVKRRRELTEAAGKSENGVHVGKNSYGNYFVTFAEKPDREILDALRNAGCRWFRGSWICSPDSLPECVKELAGMSQNQNQAAV